MRSWIFGSKGNQEDGSPAGAETTVNGSSQISNTTSEAAEPPIRWEELLFYVIKTYLSTPWFTIVPNFVVTIFARPIGHALLVSCHAPTIADFILQLFDAFNFTIHLVYVITLVEDFLEVWANKMPKLIAECPCLREICATAFNRL